MRLALPSAGAEEWKFPCPENEMARSWVNKLLFHGIKRDFQSYTL